MQPCFIYVSLPADVPGQVQQISGSFSCCPDSAQHLRTTAGNFCLSEENFLPEMLVLVHQEHSHMFLLIRGRQTGVVLRLLDHFGQSRRQICGCEHDSRVEGRMSPYTLVLICSISANICTFNKSPLEHLISEIRSTWTCSGCSINNIACRWSASHRPGPRAHHDITGFSIR